MRCINLSRACIVALLSLSAFAIDAQAVAQDLRRILSHGSGIYFPSDPDWATVTTQRWNQWNAPTYALSVKPALKEDVQKVVQYVSSHNYSFLATGGGHGYSGSLGRLDDGIELDLGNFHSVSVNGVKNRLTIGGSVRFRDIVPATYDAGKAFPVGACPCVGAAGASLGGGIGFWSGFYGAISDSLLSVEMVTGTGALITASATENSELFWALKGAGASYGAVTSFTYKVYDYPNGGKVFNADFFFPIAQNGSVLDFAKSWVGRQPKELSITLGVLYVPSSQQLLMIANIIYVGPERRGREIVQPLVDLGPVNTNISYVPWKEIPYIANFGAPARSCLEPAVSIPYAVNLYQIDKPGLIAAINLLNQTATTTPALRSFVFALTQYAPYGFQQYPVSSSAFPYRNVIQFAQLDITANTPEDISIAESFGRDFRNRLQKISGSRTLQVYTNFGFGDEGADAWYTKKNVPTLRRLKRRYDPKNLFQFYNPVTQA